MLDLGENLSKEDKKKLQKFYKNSKKNIKEFIGYPCNSIFDYRELYPFLELHINNVGDPYENSNLK